MLKVDSVFVETDMMESVSKFLVHVFEMEIVSSNSGEVELLLDNYHVKLVQTQSFDMKRSLSTVLFLHCDSLEEIQSIMQRVEFFYFSSDTASPVVTFQDELSDNQSVRVYSPDNRPWDIFYLS